MAFPKEVDVNKVVEEIKKVEDVLDLHLHVWAIITSQNAMTAHVIIHPNTGMDHLNLKKKNIK